jgi:two-component system OmpR family sensor kinase/two-component system sensor histidine kinase BaeS
MKFRLYWTMLLAFTLVIVMGVCGMLTFFGLAIAGIWEPGTLRSRVNETEQTYTAFLSDYYIAQGDSWQGVDKQLDTFPGHELFPAAQYTVVDTNSRVVASSAADQPVGRVLPKREVNRGAPIKAHGKQVGTLLLSAGPPVAPPAAPVAPAAIRRQPAFVFSVLRGFLIAGGGLVMLLLVGSALLARWFNRPIRRLQAASLALATGQLNVHVTGSRVRELDDLATSFNSMAATLSESDQQRRQMTADIAHELRTPITIIKGRLEGIQDGVYEATPDQIENLVHETVLLERLVDDLRVLALAEAGQLPLYPEPTEPRELLDRAAQTFAEQAAAQDVTLHVDANDYLPLVAVDPQRMAQVLSNLVSNALRYTPPGGRITLCANATVEDKETRRQGDKETRGRGGELIDDSRWTMAESHGRLSSVVGRPSSVVLLTVSDTGSGIAPADLPHIFDRFWRTDRARTRGSGGSGLGLAIARQIIVAHGGSIRAESADGCGTTISIVLPIANDKNKEQR